MSQPPRPPIPPGPSATGAPSAPDVQRIALRFQEASRQLNKSFLDKQEIVRLMLISCIAGEHMVIVGPPGTAKSALIRMMAQLIDARYFEYLLTRFTEPNEIFGPVDIKAFREGTYTRRERADRRQQHRAADRAAGERRRRHDVHVFAMHQ